MNKENFTTDKFLRIFILILLALMLMVVVHDRYVFHDLVYNKAVPEIVEALKQNKDSCSSFCHCRHHNDSIVKSQLISSSAKADNTNDIYQTVNVNDNSDSLNKMIEDVSSLFSLMKDVDGLISANGITFLISLIVALLIALVTDKIGVMEKLSVKVDMTKEKTEKTLKNNEDLQIKMQTSLEEAKKLYGHLANYDKLLVRVESLFNLAITIGSVTRFISLSNVDSIDNNSLSDEVGILCSRLSLLCDKIEDILNGRESRIDYLSEDEKNILLTYLADAQDELERSREEVESKQSLYSIIGNKSRLVKNIYDMIEAVETISEDNK